MLPRFDTLTDQNHQGSKRHSLQASGGAVTANKNCCANCVEPSRPQQWGPDLPFWGMSATRTGDVEINPGPTTLNTRVWI